MQQSKMMTRALALTLTLLLMQPMTLLGQSLSFTLPDLGSPGMFAALNPSTRARNVFNP